MLKVKDLNKLTNSALRDIRDETERFLDHLESYDTDEYDFYFYDLQELKSKEIDQLEKINKIMWERAKGKDSYLFDD